MLYVDVFLLQEVVALLIKLTSEPKKNKLLFNCTSGVTSGTCLLDIMFNCKKWEQKTYSVHASDSKGNQIHYG